MSHIRCKNGRYVHPDFTLEEGEVSPDIPSSEAERIVGDFPDQMEHCDAPPDPPVQPEEAKEPEGEGEAEKQEVVPQDRQVTEKMTRQREKSTKKKTSKKKKTTTKKKS